MTTHESFKRRIRARMATTGEKYNAARRALLPARDAGTTTAWVTEPDVGDDRVREHTGRGYDEWARLIDAGPGRAATHAEIARWVGDVHGVNAWWAQTVTVGYERITGLRLPGQMPDGTFSISRSRTLAHGPRALRGLLLADADRALLFPGKRTTLRSRPSAKTLRFDLSEGAEPLGVVSFRIDGAPPRVRLTVTHDKLASAALGEHWKSFWSDWLADLAEAVEVET